MVKNKMEFKEDDIFYIFSNSLKNNINCRYTKKNYSYEEALESFLKLINKE